MSHPDRPLENPFVNGDRARDQLEQVLHDIEDLKRENRMLVSAVGLLMRIENERKDKNASAKV